MPRTFEEQVVEHVDALYQGALFLRGGDEASAFDLVVRATVSTGEDVGFTADSDDVERALETELVRAHLADPDSGGGEAGGQGVYSLFEAAARLEPRARAAIFLVHMRRWGFDDAAELLGASQEQLAELLGERIRLMDPRHTEQLRSGTSRGPR